MVAYMMWAGSWIEAGLQIVGSELIWVFQVKVSRGINQCHLTGLEVMPRT
jgi:hypothetical protein